MSLRVSATGLGLAVKYNRPFVPFRRNNKTYCAVPNRGTEMNQEQAKKPSDESKNKEADMMTHAFGEGYATRSDEEGFGGIYGRNDPIENPAHVNHPEFDTSQGCEVKEKEKGRNARDGAHIRIA